MDKIKVNLLHITPQEVVINAVSKPYKNEKASLSLVKKVGYVYKHESVLEHITLNFEILGISRLCLQELARHRIASFTVESTRFTLQKIEKNAPLSDYFVFPDFKSETLKSNYEDYCRERLDELMKFREDESVKNDELKYYLSENFRTNLIFTINLRSLINFLKLRSPKQAHFEIRHLALLIIEKLKNTYISEIVDFSEFEN